MTSPVEPQPAHSGEASPAGHSSLFFDVVRHTGEDGPALASASAPRLARTAVGARLALFVLAFLLTAGGVRAFVPWPGDMGIDVHMNVFEAHKDEYQAVYVGPSTVFRSFRPDVIDPVVRAARAPFRSFNLGFAGMTGYEENFYLRKLIAMNPRQLEWIIVEPREFVVDRTMFNLFSERVLFWHDLETTAEICRGIYRDSDSWTLRGELWMAHAKVWSWRLANLGMGPRIVESMVKRSLETDAIEEWFLLRDGGFQQEYDLFANHHRTYEPDFVYPKFPIQQYLQELRTLGPLGRQHFDLDSFDLPSFLEQRSIVEGSGRKLTYVIPPISTPIAYVNALVAQGYMPSLLSFHGSDRWPRLYLARDRIDNQHLNRNGAGVFSAAFAERFAPLWAAPDEGPR